MAEELLLLQIGLNGRCRRAVAQIRAIQSHIEIPADREALSQLTDELSHYCMLTAGDQPVFTDYGIHYLNTMLWEIEQCLRDVMKRNKLHIH